MRPAPPAAISRAAARKRAKRSGARSGRDADRGQHDAAGDGDADRCGAAARRAEPSGAMLPPDQKAATAAQASGPAEAGFLRRRKGGAAGRHRPACGPRFRRRSAPRRPGEGAGVAARRGRTCSTTTPPRAWAGRGRRGAPPPAWHWRRRGGPAPSSRPPRRRAGPRARVRARAAAARGRERPDSLFAAGKRRPTSVDHHQGALDRLDGCRLMRGSSAPWCSASSGPRP